MNLKTVRYNFINKNGTNFKTENGVFKINK